MDFKLQEYTFLANLESQDPATREEAKSQLAERISIEKEAFRVIEWAMEARYLELMRVIEERDNIIEKNKKTLEDKALEESLKLIEELKNKLNIQ